MSKKKNRTLKWHFNNKYFISNFKLINKIIKATREIIKFYLKESIMKIIQNLIKIYLSLKLGIYMFMSENRFLINFPLLISKKQWFWLSLAIPANTCFKPWFNSNQQQACSLFLCFYLGIPSSPTNFDCEYLRLI